MYSNEDRLEAVEISIENAKHKIALMDSLEKLTKNKDFISIILNGYFVDEASRLVLQKAAPVNQGAEESAYLNKCIDSIAFLNQYFTKVMNEGSMATKALDEDQQTREELLAGNI